MQIEEIPGRGVSAFIEGRHIYVGNAALMEEHGIWYQTPTRVGTAIHVAVENRYWGHILLSDKLREGAFDALEDLRARGVKQMVMLTGDVLSVTRNVAAALNFDMVRAELSPAAKLSAIRYLLRGMGDDTTLAYVGDGIHDAPLFDEAERLADERYRSWEWTFGESPDFAFERTARFPGGAVTAHLDVHQGVVRRARFTGDFFGADPVAELAESLAGCPHRPDALREALTRLNPGRFIEGATAESLAELLSPQM